MIAWNRAIRRTIIVLIFVPMFLVYVYGAIAEMLPTFADDTLAVWRR